VRDVNPYRANHQFDIACREFQSRLAKSIGQRNLRACRNFRLFYRSGIAANLD